MRILQEIWHQIPPRRRLIPIIRQWWYRLWIRKDEFDISLSVDVDYYYDIRRKIVYYEQFVNTQDEVEFWKGKFRWYISDLCRRREIAHDRDMTNVME